jgi:hypothetical protein
VKTKVTKFRKGQSCRSLCVWGRLTRKKWTVIDRVEGYVSKNSAFDHASSTKRRPRVSLRLGKDRTFNLLAVRTKFGIEYVDVDVDGVEHRVVAKLD